MLVLTATVLLTIGLVPVVLAHQASAYLFLIPLSTLLVALFGMPRPSNHERNDE